MTQTAAPAFVPFTPADERQTADVLSCLGDPDLTLADAAHRHNTTLAALTLWMAQPEIAARLDALESAFARKTRLGVADALPGVASTLVEIVRDTLDELTHIPKNPHSTRSLEQRSRARESGRKAAALLLRLATFRGGPAPLPRVPRDRTSADPLPPRQTPTLEDNLDRLTRVGVTIARQAGDERPPEPPLPCPPPSTANPRVSPSPPSPTLNNSPRAAPH